MRSFCIATVLLLQVAARGDVFLEYEWGEGMVLQRGVPAPINGKDKPGTKVTVVFREKSYEADADKLTGKWKVDVEPGEPGGPFAMTIKGTSTIELKNVAVTEMALGQVLGDGMVLQRGGKAPVFGTAAPGARVSVSFREKKYDATTDPAGNWRVDVDPGAAGGPFPMTVQGKVAIELKEVYVGEVWVCSGQSNMHYALSYSKDAGKLSFDPPNPMIRLQKSPDASYAPNHPPVKFTGWQPPAKKAALEFSGTAYYFGIALQEKLKVPVGLIHSALNATGISEWTPGEKLAEIKGGSVADGGLYRRKIKTIQPFAIRGVIWYQGEANAQGKDPHGLGYDRRQAALIESWRKDWGQGDFPFLFVQLARIGFGAEQVHGTKLPSPQEREIVKDWARVRNEQRKALALVPNAGMAVSFDLTTGNLHPPEKKPIAERLALAARVIAYGEKIEHTGPVIESAKLAGNEVVLTFSHAEGLAARDGELRQFEVGTAGQDKFVPAKAKIDGVTVRLEVSGVAAPLVVRYAHREWPDGNLFNAAGLPASPFVIEDVK